MAIRKKIGFFSVQRQLRSAVCDAVSPHPPTRPPAPSNTQAPSSSRQRLPRRDGELGAPDLLHKDWQHRASPEQGRELPVLPPLCGLCHLEHEMRAEQAQAGLRRPCMGRQNLASLRLGTTEPPSGQKGSLEGEKISPGPLNQECIPTRQADKVQANVTSGLLGRLC